MLPNINGFDVLRKIRAEERFRKISVIMLTAKGSDVE
jgi:DNA-binding response OmpR family regulator